MKRPLRTTRENQRETSVLSPGWLYADLLLALFMIFLAADTSVGVPGASASQGHASTGTSTPMPTPTPLLPSTATPGTAGNTLDLNYCELVVTLTADPGAFRQGNQDAAAQFGQLVTQQIDQYPSLQGRQAGMMIVYAGAPTDTDVTEAQDVADQAYNTLASLNFFKGAVQYLPLYFLFHPANEITIHFYLIPLAGQGEACDKMTHLPH